MSTNNYSYSKLDTYQQCPFKFKLKYIDDYYVYSGSMATELGTAIHSCEEHIAKAIQGNETIDYLKLKNDLMVLLTTLKYKYPNDFDELDKSGRTVTDKVMAYLNKDIYNLEQFMKEHPTYQIVGIEQNFQLAYENDIVFNGFIDRVFYDTAADHYYIQDIKTYAIPIESRKLSTPLQFVIYAKAAEQLYNCSEAQITCQYYLPFCNGLIQTVISSGFIDRGLQKISTIFEDIKAQQFKPCPTPLCNWCEYCATNPSAPDESKYLCPYFCHWDRVSRNSADIKRLENRWQGLEKHAEIMEAYKKSLAKEVNN